MRKRLKPLPAKAGGFTPITNTKAATLKGFIQANAPIGGTVVTDNFPAYRGLNRLGYAHKVVNLSIGEYLRDKAHTNGIESFWSLLKRGHFGIYHYMSPKHLHRYVNEFSFRHNTAQVGTLQSIDMTIKRMANKRLTYKGLING